jgi:hypothetical protein
MYSPHFTDLGKLQQDNRLFQISYREKIDKKEGQSMLLVKSKDQATPKICPRFLLYSRMPHNQSLTNISCLDYNNWSQT